LVDPLQEGAEVILASAVTAVFGCVILIQEETKHPFASVTETH
jgi:hypothetical protein